MLYNRNLLDGEKGQRHNAMQQIKSKDPSSMPWHARSKNVTPLLANTTLETKETHGHAPVASYKDR